MAKIGVTSRERGALFLSVSWFVARLWLGLELSKLLLLRMRARPPAIRQVQQKRQLMPSWWVCDRNKLFCVSVDEVNDRLVVEQPLRLELN